MINQCSNRHTHCDFCLLLSFIAYMTQMIYFGLIFKTWFVQFSDGNSCALKLEETNTVLVSHSRLTQLF